MNDAPRAWRRGRGQVVLAMLLGLGAAAGAQSPGAGKDELPDAPSVQQGQEPSGGSGDGHTQGAAATRLRPCKDVDYPPPKKMPLQGPPPCIPENPIARFVTSAHIQPLSSHQKGVLAIRDFLDPFNFITIAGYSAIAIAANSHSAYGAGFKGWAKLSGYGLVEDAQGEFFQTYAIPSLLHQDPRYHRMPHANVRRRIWHAVEHTYVSQHDDGSPMLNCATLGTYVISAELSNLYVPGLQVNAESTARRIGVGIATDPTGAIVAEFLPDVAKHIHIHITFIQNILNTMATGPPNVQ